MPFLKFNGARHMKSYQGIDPGTGKNISFKTGDILEVTQKKKEQLLADYIGCFEEVSANEAKMLPSAAEDIEDKALTGKSKAKNK